MSDLRIRALRLERRDEAVRVGRKLRALRLQRHLTVAQVAEATGLSKGFISRVELEQTSPSVASLIAICRVLGIEPGAVLDHAATSVVRADEAPRVELGDDGVVEHLLTPPHQRSSQILRSVMRPGGRAGDGMYVMDCDLESVHVLSGEIVLSHTEDEVVLRPGDTATLAGDEPHSWRNDGDVDAEVLWVLTRRIGRPG